MPDKVVHLTTVHNAADPRIFHKEVKSLLDAGYDVHLVAPRVASSVVDEVPITALPTAKNRLQRLGLLPLAYRAARRLDADVYHFHDPELIPVGYLLKRTTGARAIYDMHEDYWWHGPIEGRFIRLFECWCFTWADHVIVANEHQLNITQHSSVSATRVGNYFKPIEPESSSKQKPRLTEEAVQRLIYTGVISNKGGRGLRQLLELAAILQDGGVNSVLNLVGVCYTDQERQRADAFIERFGLHSAINRVGWNRYVPWASMVPYLERAHVGLFLGTQHNNLLQKIPTKFYEYLHYGLPILCSDFPRWRRFIEKHACGAVVPPGDVSAAAQVLRRWRNNPDEYWALSEAARAAAPQYRWAVTERRLLNVYEALLRTSA